MVIKETYMQKMLLLINQIKTENMALLLNTKLIHAHDCKDYFTSTPLNFMNVLCMFLPMKRKGLVQKAKWESYNNNYYGIFFH